MIEQLIAEATKFDFKVALKTNPPKNRLKLLQVDKMLVSTPLDLSFVYGKLSVLL